MCIITQIRPQSRTQVSAIANYKRPLIESLARVKKEKNFAFFSNLSGGGILKNFLCKANLIIPIQAHRKFPA